MIQLSYDHSFIEADAGYDAWGAMAVGDFDCDGRPEFVAGGKGGGYTTNNWQFCIYTDKSRRVIYPANRNFAITYERTEIKPETQNPEC